MFNGSSSHAQTFLSLNEPHKMINSLFQSVLLAATKSDICAIKVNKSLRILNVFSRFIMIINNHRGIQNF